jgi:hypothetical protein
MGAHPRENCDLAVKLPPLTVIALGAIDCILLLKGHGISLKQQPDGTYPTMVFRTADGGATWSQGE